MSTLTHGEHQGRFVDILDWFDAPWGVFRPIRDSPIRVEDFIKDGHNLLRAEVPGIDPDKDLELMVSNGVLTIRAHRQEETETRYRLSSGTASSPAASSCRPAPTKITSRPAMTLACWR
jgi:HSP20 family protein